MVTPAPHPDRAPWSCSTRTLSTKPRPVMARQVDRTQWTTLTLTSVCWVTLTSVFLFFSQGPLILLYADFVAAIQRLVMRGGGLGDVELPPRASVRASSVAGCVAFALPMAIQNILQTFTLKLRPDSGLDCLVCAMLVMRGGGVGDVELPPRASVRTSSVAGCATFPYPPPSSFRLKSV
jgi:hypothetical protein